MAGGAVLALGVVAQPGAGGQQSVEQVEGVDNQHIAVGLDPGAEAGHPGACLAWW